MRLHRLERNHRHLLAHREIIHRHPHRITHRLARKQTKKPSSAPRTPDKPTRPAPRIPEQRLPDHDPVRSRVRPIGHHVRVRPHVAVAHHRDAQRRLERAHDVEVGRALSTAARRHMARVQRDPRRPRVLERPSERCRLPVRTQPDLGGRRDGERVRHRGDCVVPSARGTGWGGGTYLSSRPAASPFSRGGSRQSGPRARVLGDIRG